MLRFAAIREYLGSSLWFIPLLFALAAIALAIVLPMLDAILPPEIEGFGGTADGARSVLSTIAQSMLTFTGLVFTVTMLVLQLASSQLSPRVMRTFLRDRANQVVLGVFVATFVYTLVVLRDIRTPVDGASGYVPGIAVSASFVLLLGCVVAFIYYIDHMAHAIRATTVMDNIAAETYTTIDRLFPRTFDDAADESDDGEPGDPPGPAGSTRSVGAAGRGIVVAIDTRALVEAAAHEDRALVVVPRIGDAIGEDAPLFRLAGGWSDRDLEPLRAAVTLGGERTMQQDAAFGIRQLVDIALRALSPGINDPTTAVQALDRIEWILRRLAVRRFPSGVMRDEDGIPRVWVTWPSWSAHLQLATEEIARSATGHPVVARRLRSMLQAVAEVGPPQRRQEVWAVMGDIPE